MNNKTIERFDITIKRRGDNVYDLYLNGKWVVSRGCYEIILDEAQKLIKEELFKEQNDIAGN